MRGSGMGKTSVRASHHQRPQGPRYFDAQGPPERQAVNGIFTGCLRSGEKSP